MSCTDKNPLTREGTSQLNRVLAALDVHYADADERTTSDLILFAKRYAEYLNFYNVENAPEGTWQPLMMMDISVTLATISNINIQQISDYKKLLYKNIALAINSPQPARDTIAKRQFKFLFDALFSLIKIIDDQLKLLPGEEYKQIIEDVIKSKLSLPLANLQEKFFEKYIAENLLDYATPEFDSDAPFEIKSDGNFKRVNLSGVWQGSLPDLDITIPPLTSDYEKILYVINHNLFNSTVDTLIKGIALIVTRSKELFEKTLIDFPQHAPHYGLFLTFTKLFKIAQDDLNRYTKRHLDFYYKDVLQLLNKKPVPDTAHLTFELQKTVQQQLLEKDILFKGGKDITGKEINYRLTDNVVLNKATVVKIQAQQIDIKNNKPLKAFPVANSEDGEGAKLISADKSWFTFGNQKNKKTAKAGFAIASNILFLNEGSREINITVTFENNIKELKTLSGKTLSCFTAYLTGKKDWLNKNVSAVYDDINKHIVFEIGLTSNDSAVIPYTKKIHKQNFETDLPLLKIYLNQDAVDAVPYSVLCKQKITQVDITTNVTGVKDLVLSSDAGSIDASKPFKPFGDFPGTGSSFYIGSKEIFQKKITELTLSFPEAASFSPSTFYLDEGTWKSFPNISAKKITGINVEPAAIDFTANESLKATSLNGFIKLANSVDSSLDKYLGDLKVALNETTLQLVAGVTPRKYQLNVGKTPSPPEIKISNFSLNYKASSSIKFSTAQTETDNNLFYHITPFGYAEVFNDGALINTQSEKTERYTLLADVINNGEIFVGLENAEPDTVITILFQVAEGSSNPLKNMEILNWFYLLNNEWIKFENRYVIDRTNNFTQPGVVTLSFPANINNQNTLFQKGLYWIKAAVAKNIDAVCNMILIQAQAASVELVQDEANQIEFRKVIAANSISKLVVSNGAIKTITQPFDGFNGRLRESDEHFYVRVSERLRHKQRVISIWDYEHILLEQFPQLYKIKCLNHSGFYDDKGVNVFCENFPGNVTIIPIPDLKNNTHVNLLRPYTSIGLLNNINEYLKKITSPFVKLHVKNPQFEEVQLDFKVTFYDGYDESFYTQLLNKEIEKFLCPWAFDSNVEITFGSKIIKSVLLNFIEERFYVDFVTCFEMHHLLRDDETILFENKNVEEAIASTSRSILVSYYDEENDVRHIIKSPATCNC
ncbi:MAG: hypothetical protein M3015_13170 [Bacteroidota bacterium]|nr:hypothetical protein [Bacteroidota bacterium]